jgi:hypothetical protein
VSNLDPAKKNSIVLTEGPNRAAVSFALLISSPILVCSLMGPALYAQPTETDPVPEQIVSAKTVFLSNAGSEANNISERAYTALHDGLVQWKHYQPVATPAAADLILELRYTAPLSNINVSNGSSFPPNYNPRFQLTIRDRATAVILWSLTEFPFGTRKQTFEETNDNAVNALLADLKALAASQFPSTASAPAPSTPKKTRLSDEGKK